MHASQTKAKDEEIRATCRILQSIATRYPRGSAERAAIRKAAEAFVYVRLHQSLKATYEAFRRSCAKPLTKGQRQTLRKMGVP